jgi:hypothetical protein
MRNLEKYLDCQPINDLNIDDGKVKGNILINDNYNINNCVDPNYNSYERNILERKDYTNNELYTSSAVNIYAILYAITIGLLFTLMFVNIIINVQFITKYRKIMIGTITFMVTLSTIYSFSIYFISNSKKRIIHKIDKKQK